MRNVYIEAVALIEAMHCIAMVHMVLYQKIGTDKIQKYYFRFRTSK